MVLYFQIFQPRRERGRVFEAFKLRGQATVVPDKAGLRQHHHICGAGVDDHHGGDRGDDDGDNSNIYVIVF